MRPPVPDLHNVAGNTIVYVVIFRASICAERLKRFQSARIANVMGMKDATSDPHSVTESSFVFHLLFMQVKQILPCGNCVVK